MSPCRTMIVDDEPDMLALVALQIELANDGLCVAATASCGEDAVRTALDVRPDVVVLDYMMPDCNGVEVAEKILYEDPSQDIVLFSAFITDVTASAALRVGIRECVRKDQVKELPGILRKYGRKD